MGVELVDNFNSGLYKYCELENGVHGTEIVKNSLKCKILERRKHLGLGSILVDFKPKVSHPMTEDEQDKDRRRKQSNRNSADRCRKKQKEECVRNEHLLQELKEEQKQLLRQVSALELVKHNIVNKLKKSYPESKIHTALGRIDYTDNIQRKNIDDRGKIGEREDIRESNDMMEYMNTDEVLEEVSIEVPDVVTVSDGLFINASTFTANLISYPTNGYPFRNSFEDIARPIDDNICFEIGTAMSLCDQNAIF